MILQKEIIDISKKLNIAPKIIDKDYILGHYLNELYSIEELKTNLAFKGGTALRKCYFENFRFSEDLDFTSTSNNFFPDNNIFDKIKTSLLEKYNINITNHNFEEKKYENRIIGYQSKIKYWGPNHKKGDIPDSARWTESIKIEISTTENVYFQTEFNKLNHNFSDKKSIILNDIQCYSLNEILVEKLRCLLQRNYTAPRDYFDLWYLFKNEDFDFIKIKEVFLKKCSDKGYTDIKIKDLINKDNFEIIKKHWNKTVKDLLIDDNISVDDVLDFLQLKICNILE